jgi:SAM-dependent methyltransferase
MGEHRSSDIYAEAFQVFLSKTDEKVVLREALEAKLDELKPNSMLDIGAGNGDLSIPLSRKVHSYVAVEQNPKYIERLEKVEVKTLHGIYPFEIADKFDIVLVSHALPSHSAGRDGWQPFINSAVQQLKPRGHLLLVTFEDEKSEWNSLIEDSGLDDIRPRERRLESLKTYLQGIAHVEVSSITTHVRTESLKDLIRALAFVWSDGKVDKLQLFVKNKRIPEYLKTHHTERGGYAFPFLHYFLDARID